MGTTEVLHRLTRDDKLELNVKDEWLIIKVPKGCKEIMFVDYCDGDAEYEFHWLEGPYLSKLTTVQELLDVRRSESRSSRRRRELTEFRDDPEEDKKDIHGN